MENEVKYLFLDDIIPNRFQPRENFDEQALKELAVSIREHGVIQPIVVRQVGEKYEIIAGERRYKASTMAGLTKIPAIIRNLDDKESSKVALIENLQRKDLTPIEEARTYQKILELDALTQEELAKTMGKSQSAVSNKLRLLSLTDEVQDALLHEQISERHARSLLNITDPTKQVELLKKVINSRMTVRELDQEIKGILEGGSNDSTDGGISLEPPKEEKIESTLDINDVINPKPVPINDPTKVDITEQQKSSIDINDALYSNPSNNNTINLNLEEEKPKDEEVLGGSGLFSNINLSKPASEPKEEINLENSLYTAVDNKEEKPIQENNEPSGLYDSVVKINDSDQNESTENVVGEVKDAINKIKSTGKNIDVEEFDFDDFYQLVIRINK